MHLQWLEKVDLGSSVYPWGWLHLRCLQNTAITSQLIQIAASRWTYFYLRLPRVHLSVFRRLFASRKALVSKESAKPYLDVVLSHSACKSSLTIYTSLYRVNTESKATVCSSPPGHMRTLFSGIPPTPASQAKEISVKMVCIHHFPWCYVSKSSIALYATYILPNIQRQQYFGLNTDSATAPRLLKKVKLESEVFEIIHIPRTLFTLPTAIKTTDSWLEHDCSDST